MSRSSRRQLVVVAAALAVGLAGVAGRSPSPAAAGGGAGVGTPGPIVFVRDDWTSNDPFPSHLWTLSPGGTPVIVPNSDTASDARWSPDGQVIAYTTWESGIFLINPDGSGKRSLFTPGEGEHFGTPLWSPDGRKLAFTAHTNGANMHLEIADSLDGTREVVPTDLSYVFDWAADGSFWGPIIRNWDDPITGHHYTEDLAVTTPNGETRELTATADIHEGVPRLSPDGTRVAFTSFVDATAVYKVEVMNVDGTGRRAVASTQTPTWPTWSPDGKHLLYVHGYQPTVVDLQTGVKTPLTDGIGDSREGFDWAPLPGTVTAPAPAASAARSSSAASAVVSGGIRALALPDPSTRATSSVSGATIWPYRDGYRDSLRINLRMNEPARSRVDIFNRAGSRVKAVSLGWRTGPLAWIWNGRNARGVIFASGRYRIVTTSIDLAGNVLKKTTYVTLYRSRH